MAHETFTKATESMIDPREAVRRYRRVAGVLRRPRPMRATTRAQYENELRKIELALLLGDHSGLTSRLGEERVAQDQVSAAAREGGATENQLNVLARKRDHVARLLSA